MKITKRQLRQIIKEEKLALLEMEDDYGLDNPRGIKGSVDEQDGAEAVDPEESLYDEVEAMQKATDSLRTQFNELEAQMQDVAARIPGNVFNRNRKAVMLQIIEEAGEALDDLERHFSEAHSRMGGWNRL